MVRGLAYFRHQTLDIGDLGAICGNRDGNGIRPFGWKSIESLTGGFACRGFAGCDVDFGTAGLEETGKLGFSKPRIMPIDEESKKKSERETSNPDAA